MEKNLISVIMPVYNTDEGYLIAAVKSILEQTYSYLELIIVDDCSKNFLYSSSIFKDKRIKLILNKTNCGPSASRNLAIKQSRGKYIAIMDSDDISDIHRLEEQYEFLENNPQYVLCTSWYKTFGSFNKEFRVNLDDFEYYKCSLFFQNKPTILHSSVMIRGDILRKHGILYDEELKYGEDYKTWINLSNIGKFYVINKFLINYRVHSNQLTNQERNNELRRNCRIKIKKWYISYLKWGAYLDDFDILNISYPLENETSPLSLIKTLKKIKKANNSTKAFSKEKFNKRIKQAWKEKVEEINNPLKIIMLTFASPNTIIIKTKQLLRKVFNF